MPWRYQYLCVAEAIHANLFPDFMLSSSGRSSTTQGEPGRYGGAELFLNMVRFLLLQEGKAPEETVEKLQACETVEEAQRFLEDFQKGLKTGEPALDQKKTT